MICQTYDNWEWYLTDNASTDQTPAIIESFLQAHPDERIHYFKRKYNTLLQPGKEKDPFLEEILPSFVGKDYYITSPRLRRLLCTRCSGNHGNHPS